MSVFFQKKNGRFEVQGCYANLNLLAHAQMIELDIGSECGGHGICGKDRVQVPTDAAVEGLVSPPSEEEQKHLSSEELAQGWRLACQCYPEKDGLELELKTRI